MASISLASTRPKRRTLHIEESGKVVQEEEVTSVDERERKWARVDLSTSRSTVDRAGGGGGSAAAGNDNKGASAEDADKARQYVVDELSKSMVELDMLIELISAIQATVGNEPLVQVCAP